jgi:hypothetical protein
VINRAAATARGETTETIGTGKSRKLCFGVKSKRSENRGNSQQPPKMFPHKKSSARENCFTRRSHT